jgi:hypothetical protein
LPDDTRSIIGNRREIHETMFELQKKYPILKSFVFSTKGISPVSQKLEETLFGLLLINIIFYTNPSYQKLAINENAKVYIKKNMLKCFDDGEMEQLKEISEEFNKKIREKYANPTRIS